MKYLTWYVAFGMIVVLTVSAGMMHGTMHRRWGVSEREEEAARLLTKFPRDLGNWKTISEGMLDKTSLKILQPTASFLRTMKREGDGVPVIMSVLVGPPGYIGAHTPEVCISGTGYEQIGPKEKVTISLPESPELRAEFWVATFRSRGLDRHILREYWAWSTGENWQASTGSRLGYGFFPYLYKAQFGCRLPAGANIAAVDPTPDLLRLFVLESSNYVIPAGMD